MNDQATFDFATEAATDITVDREPDQYGFYFARPVKLGTRAPVVVGSGARTPEEAERLLRKMLAAHADFHDESPEDSA